MIQAARTADPGVTGLQARTAWWWIKAHAIPVARYLGKGSRGTDALREELEVENEGVRIPSPVRWLSGAASVKARYNEKIIAASSVVFAVADESVYRSIRKEDCVSRDAGTTPRPTRRPGQTWGVATALGGAISSQSATGRMRDVGGAPVVTLRRNTDARWRDVVLERAAGVDTPW